MTAAVLLAALVGVVRPVSATPVVVLAAVLLMAGVLCVLALSFFFYRRSGRR